MTDITYKGANCVTIQTKTTAIITDPVIDGAKPPKELAKARAVLISQPRYAVDINEAEQIAFTVPGEYEVGDFSVSSRQSESQLDPAVKATVFRIETPDVRLATLGHVNPDKVDDALIEDLGVIDVLILPIGGAGYTIDAHGAAKLARRIAPKVVIPVHFKEDGVNYEVPQGTIEDFARELGVQIQEEASLKIKQAGQLPESLSLIRLTV
ncbi:MBL fold metallo-hydrolase [Candidatus Saccharibacteria bacterium]|nr:MBL fold metallo-hydrolase [Candidatus Saccharibacteria bacterium]